MAQCERRRWIAEEREGRMNRLVPVTVVSAALMLVSAVGAGAAEKCPDELTTAKGALKSAQSSLKRSTPVAKSQQGQASRAYAGAKSDVQAPRGQDIQAPRGQDIQAPRGQDIQAPRGQDVQAPRGQDIQAPRGQDVQAPRGQDMASRVKKADALIRQADAACKKGNMALSAQKAKDALTLLGQ
jgi:hypothetical protein